MEWKTVFQFANADYLNQHFRSRPGETRWGQTIQYPRGSDPWESLKNSSARFVVLGIPEDIGVRANLGQPGAASLWRPTLEALLNRQAHRGFRGGNLFLLGEVDTRDWMQAAEGQGIQKLRELVAEMDTPVSALIEDIVRLGKIPLVVGGGHNQAYGLLKGSSLGKGHPVHVLNLDAHADFRAMEGRHSGNGFRYARAQGYLDRYAVLGLARDYNAEFMVEELSSDPRSFICFYEDMFLQGADRFAQELESALNFLGRAEAGIELDMDALDGVPSSAMSWGGFSVRESRIYLRRAAQGLKPLYFHLTEGAVIMEGREKEPMVAKLAAQLLADFLESAQISLN